MSNIIQTFPKGGSPTYAGLPDKPTVNNIDIEALNIEGMDVIDNSGTTEISASGLNADSMADVTSGEVNNYAVTGGNTYTTGEQIVGRWLDGKPIYQRTFVITDFSSPNLSDDECKQYRFLFTDIPVDYVLNLFGFVRFTYESDRSSWNYRFINSTINYPGAGFDTWQEAKTLSIYANCSTAGISLTIGQIPFDYYDQSAYITIQYTKTTDT